MTATSTPGIVLRHCLSPMITTRHTTPMVVGSHCASPFAIPFTRLMASSMMLSPEMLNPNSFGNWPRMTTSAMPLR